MRYFLLEALMGFILILAIGILAAGGIIMFRGAECEEYSEVTGYPTEFHWLGGCYVVLGIQKIPKDNFLYIERDVEPLQR